MKKVASFFDYFLAPILIPTYTFLLLFLTDNPYIQLAPLPVKQFLTSLTFACMSLAPTLILFYMKKKGIVSDIHLTRKNEKNLFYGITFLFCVLLTYSFYTLGSFSILFSIIPISGIFVLAGLVIANIFINTSSHMATLASVITFFIIYSSFFKIYSLFFILLHILLMGMMGTSQLILQQHSNKELFIGSLVGVISTLIAIIAFYFWNITLLLK